MEQITYDKLIIAIGVIMILIGAYNTIMSAVKTHREETKRRNAPTVSLETVTQGHTRQINSLESDVKDMRDGQKCIVEALQALLEHELHNGNSQQMMDASANLNKWLTNKI